MPSLRRNIEIPNPIKARRTASPERRLGGAVFRSAAAMAKTKKPIGNVKKEVAAPRMLGWTRAIEMAAAAMIPRKPKTRSRQVARLAASHQIRISKQHRIGPKTEIIQ